MKNTQPLNTQIHRLTIALLVVRSFVLAKDHDSSNQINNQVAENIDGIYSFGSFCVWHVLLKI